MISRPDVLTKLERRLVEAYLDGATDEILNASPLEALRVRQREHTGAGCTGGRPGGATKPAKPA